MARLLTTAAALLALLVPAATAAANDSTVAENGRAGDNRWQGTAAEGAVLAYSEQPSVVAGEDLEFYVKTNPASAYRVEIHRLGWYGGTGGRRVGCFPAGCSATTTQGNTQTSAGSTDEYGRFTADWTNGIHIPTSSTWASGYYIFEFILAGETNQTTGPSMRVPVIVRSPRPRADAILVQAPTNTWQAYNRFGGRSLYSYDPDGAGPLPTVQPARRVSYDRPYGSETGNGGTSALFRYEYQVVKWLEREGREVEYTTNVDVDREPASLRAHDLVVSVGHDEYWTKGIYDAFAAARDAGVNIMFLGSNIAYWHVRLEDAGRTVVGFKQACSSDYGVPRTCLMRQVVANECQLLGVRWNGGWTAAGIGVVAGSPDIVDRDYTVTAAGAAHPWMRAAGFAPGESLDMAVGYEWDSVYPGCRTEAVRLFEHDGPADGDADKGWSASVDDTKVAHATVYTAPSGARVFASGSMQFNLFLDQFRRSGQQNLPPENGKVKAFLRAMIDDLAGNGPEAPIPAPPPPPPVPSPVPTPPLAPPADPGTPAPPADLTAPRLVLRASSAQRALRTREVVLRARCDEACVIRAVGTFTGVSSRATRAAVRAGAGQTVVVTLPVRRSMRAAVRRALRRHKRVTLRVVLTVSDVAGNTASTRRSIRLRA